MLRTLVNLNPIAELQQVTDMMDRAFSEFRDSVQSGSTLTQGWSLPVDIFERENQLMIRAAVPGIQPDQLDISVDQSVLTIQGEIEEKFEQNDVIYRREYRHGAFSRAIRLPENADVNGISADFENGFVTITIPKIVPAKPQPKKIEVRNANPNQKALGEQNTHSKTNGTKESAKPEIKQPAQVS
jgi:HSP20 family protein